ncbi:MAG: hypothetical protein KAI80_11050, partial [Hyphomicrobiaceae bacterium]|nr:hypothetical protein [Hyphomicrobiaceae bacterium]
MIYTVDSASFTGPYLLLKCTTSVIQETPDVTGGIGGVAGSREARRWSRALKGIPDDGGAGHASNTKPTVREAPIGKLGTDPVIPPVPQSDKTFDGQPRQSSAQPRDVIAVPPSQDARDHIYGALDLGTNNCRLLVAPAADGGFRVIDAFSRIVRLGEGLGGSGRLSEAAMVRTLEALEICATKMRRRGVTRLRAVATEACRRAANCDAFLQRVARETGIEIEIISNNEEANLAIYGCAPLLDRGVSHALVF